jgi:hypothetical protein
MADFAEVDGFTQGVPAHGGASGLVTFVLGWAGALMSVALVVGLGVWGYQLAMRDVTGVPVGRALEGPMRVAPEDPGGTQAAHQGLAVNSVAAEGAAAAPAERLVLAPPPLHLTEEDMPRPDLEGSGITETTLGDAPRAARPGEVVGETDMLALADSLADGVSPLEVAPLPVPETLPETGASAEPDAPGIEAGPTDAPAILTSTTGVTRSVVPRARPFGDATAMAIASEVALAVARPTNLEVDPARIPAGTRLVQFGAYDSPDQARDAWSGLEQRFGDFLDGKQRIVQEAVSGGKTFYRLRAMGFADINDARRFCAALVAERQACIPVVVR